MNINETGTYEFLKDVRLRTGATGIATFPKGMRFTVKTIDKVNRNFLSPELEDWNPTFVDWPVQKLNGD
jgi:hypothetical protein